ncbi:hypothetical protein QVD17_32362 [Tagetes erecta]|uniref:Uncharacterized protein n=1 Tax=Tagetes erecta TaxID=13708 RepID=A0AAD8K7V9_TARER|nr:hypothetical protein QVD17_32362 [Tagetes erecta]
MFIQAIRRVRGIASSLKKSSGNEMLTLRTIREIRHTEKSFSALMQGFAAAPPEKSFVREMSTLSTIKDIKHTEKSFGALINRMQDTSFLQ